MARIGQAGSVTRTHVASPTRAHSARHHHGVAASIRVSAGDGRMLESTVRSYSETETMSETRSEDQEAGRCTAMDMHNWMLDQPSSAPLLWLASLLWTLSCGTSVNGPDRNSASTLQSRPTSQTAPHREGISSPPSSAEPKHGSSPPDVLPHSNDVCPLLTRPGCTPRRRYGGVLDHFVDVECSTLFEIRRELPLSGTPRRFARGIVLIEEPSRRNVGGPKLLSFDYTAVASREEKLVLTPAAAEIRAVLYDDEHPTILGRTQRLGAEALDWSLWRIQCQGSCRTLGHVRFRSAYEVDTIPDLLPTMRQEIVETVTTHEREERRKWCKRSSAGCRGKLSNQELAPGQRPSTDGTLPHDTHLRIARENGDHGIFLIRTKSDREIDRQLLVSRERSQPLGTVALLNLQPVGPGYVALLRTSQPAVFGALIRFDAEGTLIGAPVLTATFAQDVWLSGCADSVCLVATYDAAVAESPIARVIGVTGVAPPPCESQTSAHLRY